MTILIFDLETTGLLLPSCSEKTMQPRIIEIGAIKLNARLDIVGELSQLINPEIEISKKITKITGITNKQVEGSPTFLEFLPQLKEFFEDVDMLIAHNASFDMGVLNSELERIECKNFQAPKKIICTVLEYQHLFGGYVKLKDLYKHVLGVELHQTHRALDDCRALYEILKNNNFMEILGEKHEG
jgi:DNA polymerase-3 subunit alpha (Gram-positive type)